MKYAFIIFYVLLTMANAWADDCLQNRAAFDIGSGTTKMVVAQVDTCMQHVKQIFEEKEIAVGYKEDLGRSQGEFSEDIQRKGLTALRQLKSIAKKYNPQLYVGVATSAFRSSHNGTMLADRISRELGINTQIITQRTEAVLGFLAAYPQTGLEKKECFVWDIGGGSMQMVIAADNGSFDVYEGKLASVSMKNMIITDIQGKSPKDVNSPNPMGKSVADKAVNLARDYAEMHVQDSIKKNAESLTVLGIGGVHYHSVRKQSVKDEKTYTISDVERTLAIRHALSDEEIGGDYAATDVSNLTLVLGFMKALNIEKIRTLKANMAHGILVYPKYWE
jgi:exopolyphosphatase/guanosine-5'-triphosphate,3'-diphosphate pyrophosphatase